MNGKLFFLIMSLGNCILLGIAIEQHAGRIFLLIAVILSLIGLYVTSQKTGNKSEVLER